MFNPSSYIKTLQRSHDPPPPKQDRSHQGKLLEIPQYTIKFCRTCGMVEVKGTYHHHPPFIDGESRDQQREWPRLSPLFSCAVTEPGPDRTPDRQPCSHPLHPASCFRQLSRGAYMAAGRRESHVQITSISQKAKKEVETVFLPPTGYLWVAQLQEATEHAGKLEPHSEKPLPATGKEASFKSVAGHPHSTMLVSTQPSHPAAAAAKSLQSCLTLCNPTDGSPPGSTVPGIL